MRVLYITGSMPFGPWEVFFVPEVKEMVRQGCELLIVPRQPRGRPGSRDAEALAKLSLPRPLLSAEILAAAAGEFLRHPLRVLKALGLLLRSPRPDTLLRNLAVYPKALWMARAARNWGAQHIHAQWASTNATMALVASELTGLSWSCTAHRGDILSNNLLALKARRAAFIRFISEDGLRIARSLSQVPLQGDLFVLHSCVEMPANVEPRAAMSVPPILLCPGVFCERKGHRYLIEALVLLRNRGVEVLAHLAGEGELETELRAMVAARGLQDSVVFLGWVKHAELQQRFRDGKVDVVVLPSLHEGVPAGLIEAMGYAIPVVSTETGGIPELLRDGAGLLVPPRDPTALADALEKLLRDSALRLRSSAAGRKRVEEEWGTKKIVGQLLDRIRTATESMPKR